MLLTSSSAKSSVIQHCSNFDIDIDIHSCLRCCLACDELPFVFGYLCKERKSNEGLMLIWAISMLKFSILQTFHATLRLWCHLIDDFRCMVEHLIQQHAPQQVDIKDSTAILRAEAARSHVQQTAM